MLLALPFAWVRSESSCAGGPTKVISGFDLIVSREQPETAAIALILLVTPLGLGFLVHREASAIRRALADTVAALLSFMGAAFLYFLAHLELFSYIKVLTAGWIGVFMTVGMGVDAALEAGRGVAEVVRMRRAKRAIASVATLYENEQDVRIEAKLSSRPPPLYTFDDDESSQEIEAQAQAEEEAAADHSPSKAPRS